MKWLEVSIRVGREEAEAIAGIFARHGQGGVALDEAFIPCPEGEGYSLDPQGPVTVRAYLPVNRTLSRRRRLLEAALGHLSLITPLPPLRARLIEEEDWAQAWKEHFTPLRLGRIVVKPSWREYTPGAEELVIEMDPGMAFGTGHHPTTAACLRELEACLEPGMEVLDLGTGSGILALAAARLGAGRVLALDIDETAVKMARANVRRNKLGRRVRAARGTALLGGGLRVGEVTVYRAFPLVLANLVAATIVSLAPALAKLLQPGGWLIAGGIIVEREEEVRERLEGVGLEVARARADGDWITLVARRAGRLG